MLLFLIKWSSGKCWRRPEDAREAVLDATTCFDLWWRPRSCWRRPLDAGISFSDSTTCQRFCGVHRGTGGVLRTPESISRTPPLANASAAFTEVQAASSRRRNVFPGLRHLPTLLWRPQRCRRRPRDAGIYSPDSATCQRFCGVHRVPGDVLWTPMR